MGPIEIIKDIHQKVKEFNKSLEAFKQSMPTPEEQAKRAANTRELAATYKELNRVSDLKEMTSHFQEAEKAGSELRKILLELNKTKTMKIKLSRKKLNKIIKALNEIQGPYCSYAGDILKAMALSDKSKALKAQAKKQKETKENTKTAIKYIELLNNKIRLERLHKQLEITVSALKIQAENGSMNDKTLNKFDKLKDQIERCSI